MEQLLPWMSINPTSPNRANPWSSPLANIWLLLGSCIVFYEEVSILSQSERSFACSGRLAILVLSHSVPCLEGKLKRINVLLRIMSELSCSGKRSLKPRYALEPATTAAHLPLISNIVGFHVPISATWLAIPSFSLPGKFFRLWHYIDWMYLASMHCALYNHRTCITCIVRNRNNGRMHGRQYCMGRLSIFQYAET